MLALASGIVLGANLLIIVSSHPYRYARIEDTPQRPIAVVFGADLKKDRTPTHQLADRIDAGMALYRAGKVRALLFTGDDGTQHHDEVGAMLRYAIEHGFNPHAITTDGAGFDTYDSCYRAKHVFGVHSALLVTQSYHLGRAVFLCRSMGIDAVGFAQPDWGNFSMDTMERTLVRETFARVKAVWEGLVTHPLPPGERPSPAAARR
jgi:vancomycin permeability regulator SanA